MKPNAQAHALAALFASLSSLFLWKFAPAFQEYRWDQESRRNPRIVEILPETDSEERESGFEANESNAESAPMDSFGSASSSMFRPSLKARGPVESPQRNGGLH